MRISIPLFLLLIFVVFFSGQAYPQRIPFRNYTTEDGLAQSQVLCIHQDSKGYLWFGNGSVISVYDGAKFVTYTTKDGLPTRNLVYTMLEDRTGNLWLGTLGGGICRFDSSICNRDHAVIYNTDNGLPNNQIFCSFQDSRGGIWFGTDSGAVRFNGKDFKVFSTDEGLPASRIRAIAEDNDGNLWFSAWGEGVYKYESGIFNHYSARDGLANDHVYAIVKDKKGMLWFATRSGLSGLNPNEPDRGFITFTVDDGLVYGKIYSLAVDRANNLWLGSDSHGICKYDGKSFVVYNTSNGLINDRVYCIIEDREYNIWFGTIGGISKLTNQQFENYTTEYGLCNSYVTAVAQDRRGDFWFGTNGGGVSKLSHGEFTNYTTEDGLSHNVVRAICDDAYGNMWLGTRGGISIFDGKRFPSIGPDQGLVSDYVRDIAIDQNGNFWIATDNGVSRIEKGTRHITNFTTQDGLAHPSVWAVLCDRHNVLWFATYEGGVYKFADGGFTCFNKSDGLTGNQVFSILEDSDGNLWFGTTSGVSKFDGENFTNYTAEDGLSSNSVWLILQDRDHNLWFGTNRGIDRFDGATWRNYDARSGLAASEINIHSGIVDRDGKLWFGSVAGVTKYDPSKDIPRNIPPLIYIEQLQISDVPFPLDNAQRLAHDQNNIAFDFLALSFGDQSALQYRYFLEGFDRTWSKISSRRYAKYTNLKNGHYTFNVEARNRDGIWSSKPAKFSFVITPPLWQTLWFKLLVTIFAVCSALGIHLLRTRAIRLRNVALEKKVATRTKDLKISEAKYRNIVENIEDVYYRIDNAGNLVMMSPSGLRLMGYDSVQDLLGKNIVNEFFENAEAAQSFFDKVRKEGRLLRYEFRPRLADGNRIIAEGNSRLFLDEKGNEIGIEGLFTDVTERRRAEENLRKSREILQSMVDNVDYGLCVMDLERRILESNRKMREWFPDVADGVHPFWSQDSAHGDKAIANVPTVHTIEISKKTANVEHKHTPSKVSYQITAVPVFDEHNRAVATVEIIEKREPGQDQVFITICSGCKNVRLAKKTDTSPEVWIDIETFVIEHLPKLHSENIAFIHGLCSPCVERLYGKILRRT